MRRAITAIVTTAVGLVLLLSFKSHAGGSGPLAALIQPAPNPSPTPSSTTPKSSGATKGSVTTTRTITGGTYQTRYGPVQVRVTLNGKKLVDVAALQLPQGNGRDIEIDNFAVPQLRQEALDAQSANINSVSGATYTSAGYIRSLQSALDKA